MHFASKIITAFCLSAFLSVTIASAQSGRKPDKPTKPTPPPSGSQTSTPPAQTTTSSETTPTDYTPKPQPAKVAIVVVDDGSSKNNQYARIMLDEFVRRLSDSETANASYAGVLKKAAAANRSKTEKDGWVVYVEIKVDHLSSSGVNYSNPDMSFNYIVYQAGSDQEKVKGKSKYQSGQSNGRGPLGMPSPIPQGTGKMTPEETGRTAADQVMIAIQANTRNPKVN